MELNSGVNRAVATAFSVGAVGALRGEDEERRESGRVEAGKRVNSETQKSKRADKQKSW